MTDATPTLSLYRLTARETLHDLNPVAYVLAPSAEAATTHMTYGSDSPWVGVKTVVCFFGHINIEDVAHVEEMRMMGVRVA